MCLTGSCREALHENGMAARLRRGRRNKRPRHDPLPGNRDGRMISMDSYPAIKESELSELLRGEPALLICSTGTCRETADTQVSVGQTKGG